MYWRSIEWMVFVSSPKNRRTFPYIWNTVSIWVLTNEKMIFCIRIELLPIDKRHLLDISIFSNRMQWFWIKLQNVQLCHSCCNKNRFLILMENRDKDPIWKSKFQMIFSPLQLVWIFISLYVQRCKSDRKFTFFIALFQTHSFPLLSWKSSKIHFQRSGNTD